jgi:hypothetical protein
MFTSDLRTPEAQNGIVPRRHFLKSTLQTIAGAVACAMLPAAVFAQTRSKGERKTGLFRVPDETKRTPLFDVNRSTFAPLLGDEFQLSGNVVLTLVEINSVTPLPGVDAARFYERSFSLVFRAPKAEREFLELKSRSYQLRHQKLGELEIFLTPVHQSAGWQFYEAVFNRLD